MAKIIFKGLTRADDAIFNELAPRPTGAVTLALPKNPMRASVGWMLPAFALCFAALGLKGALLGDFPLVRTYIPLGLVAGVLLCFVHELLHALPQPRGARAWIGVIPAKLMFYMKCSAPVSRGRFIFMSLLPVVLGILPLILFFCTGSGALRGLLWPMAMIGLASPAPDYLNVAAILRQTPRGAWIQDDEDGLCWFVPQQR